MQSGDYWEWKYENEYISREVDDSGKDPETLYLIAARFLDRARGSVGGRYGCALEYRCHYHRDGVEYSECCEAVDCISKGAQRTKNGRRRDEGPVERKNRKLDKGKRNNVEGSIDEPCYQNSTKGSLNSWRIRVLSMLSISMN